MEGHSCLAIWDFFIIVSLFLSKVIPSSDIMRFNIIPPRGKEIIVPKAVKCAMVKGEDLLMFLRKELDIDEFKEYFGLLYCDKRSGEMNVLDENDNLKTLKLAAGKNMTLYVVATFHPEHPEKTFQTPASRRLFCDLMKDKLVSGELGCDVDTHAYLDAMYLQAVIGKQFSSFLL